MSRSDDTAPDTGDPAVDATLAPVAPQGATIASQAGADATIASSSQPSSGAGSKPSGGHVIRPPQAAATAPDYPELVVVDPAHYVLGAQIAEGGMGQIRAARDRRLGRAVAIKSLRGLAGERGSPLAVRFEREARITARLQHPAIVQLHEAGTWPNGEPFYAMKLVEGRSLDDAIAGCATLADRLALLPNVVTVAEAIAYAHDHHVIHRDIKPRNVLVGAFGETVVIDWGLAKDLRDGAATAADDDVRVGPYRATATDSGQTVAGDVLGTPAYMPLEQAHGNGVDERADVYAIGALLYHLLAGVAPYEGRTANEILAQLIGRPPIAIAERAAGTPPDLVAIVEKAMAREAADRYPTAKELAADLRRFTTGQLVGAHEYSTWQLARRWIRKHRGVATVSVAAALALGLFGAYSIRRIVGERDAAEAARKVTNERDERLALEHAKEILDDDPTLAVATLGKLAPTSPLWPEARPLVVAAWTRGIAPRVLLAHDGPAARLRTTADGRIVSAGPDGTVRVWAPGGTAPLATITGHHGGVVDLVLSPTGTVALSLGIDGTARIAALPAASAPAAARIVARSLAADGETVTRIAGFTPDGATAVLLTRDAVLRCAVAGGACTRLVPVSPAPTHGTIQTRVDETGRESTTRTIETWTDAVVAAAVSPTAPIVATCGATRVTLWDVAAGKERAVIPQFASACAFMPDGILAIADELGIVYVDPDHVDAPPHRRTLGDMPPPLVGGHVAGVALDVAADGKRIAVAGRAVYFTARLDPPRAAKPAPDDDDKPEVAPLAPLEHAIHRIAVSPDGNVVALAGPAGVEVIAVDADGRARDRLVLAGAREVAFAPDGTLVTAFVDGSVRLWDLRAARGKRVLEPAAGFPSVAHAGATPAAIAIAHADGSVLVGDRAITALADCADIELAPDGLALRAHCNGGTTVVAVATGEVTGTLPARAASAWAPPHRLVAWSAIDPTLAIVDDPLAGAGPKATLAARDVPLAIDPAALTGATAIAAVRVARTVPVLAVVTGAGTVMFVDAATGTTTRVVANAPCTPTGASAIAWDGGAFACADGRTIWLARATGAAAAAPPAELRGHLDQVSDLAFLSDGALASTGRDRALRVWAAGGTSRPYQVDPPGAIGDSVGKRELTLVAGPGRAVVTLASAGARVWDLDAGAAWALPGAEAMIPVEPAGAFVVATRTQTFALADGVPHDGPALAAFVRAATTTTTAPVIAP